MADKTKTSQKGWGIHITVPHGTLTEQQAADLQDSAHKLLPHFVEAVAKAHGIDASGSIPHITRSPGR